MFVKEKQHEHDTLCEVIIDTKMYSTVVSYLLQGKPAVKATQTQ